MPNDADLIYQTARQVFGGDGLKSIMSGPYRDATTFIKKTLGDLGKSLDYLVAASGYSGSNYNGWLYDMVWYVSESECPRMLLRIPMVLESELHLGKVAHVAPVNPDFEKLIQARSDVRVWCAAVHNEKLTKQHLENCKEQIRKFTGSSPGDTYIFVIYTFSTKVTLVEQFQAPGV